MLIMSCEGMSTLSSHVVAGVLMALTAHKGMSTLSSKVLMALTAHRGMSTLSSKVTHKSPRVLYNHRQIHSQKLMLNSCIKCNLIGLKSLTYSSLHVTSSLLNQAPQLDERQYSSLNNCTISVTTTSPVTSSSELKCQFTLKLNILITYQAHSLFSVMTGSQSS